MSFADAMNLSLVRSQSSVCVSHCIGLNIRDYLILWAAVRRRFVVGPFCKYTTHFSLHVLSSLSSFRSTLLSKTTKMMMSILWRAMMADPPFMHKIIGYKYIFSIFAFSCMHAFKCSACEQKLYGQNVPYCGWMTMTTTTSANTATATVVRHAE